MLDIITVLGVRSAYDKYRHSVPDKVLSKEAETIINDLPEYYSLFPSVEVVDWDQFSAWFCFLKHSSFTKEKLDLFKEVFNNLKEFEVTAVTEEVVRSFIERDFAEQCAEISLKISEGSATNCLGDVRHLADEYERAAQVIKDDGFVEDDILDLVASRGKSGLNWRLDALNKSLGPLRKGNLVVFAKLPESGGTAMAVSECTNFLTQLADDDVILYLGNEENGEAIRERIVSSVIGKSWKGWVVSNAVEAKDLFLGAGGNRIKILPTQGWNMSRIKQKIKEVQPKVIVFDQLWKVQDNKKGQSDVAKITSLFEQARIIAAEFAPVIAIHQADGSAYSSKYAEMDQMYMSRIGVQGECDAIVTLGIDPNDKTNPTRYLNVCKNKLEGGDDSDESLRHSKWEVTLLPELSRFKD